MFLRDYQRHAVENLLSDIRNVCLVAPTGSGKSVILSAFIKRHGKRALWVAHRKELVEQAAAHLRTLDMDTGIIMAGHPQRAAQIQVGSIQTLNRRTMPDVDIVIIDEAHHAKSKSYAELFAGRRVIGATATPFRLDGQGLGELFDELVVAATPKQLVADGYLCEPVIYSHDGPDVSAVKKTAGDYNSKQLSEACNIGELVADIVDTWQQRAFGLRTVCFASSIDHSLAIMQKFNDRDINAVHIDASTPRLEREGKLLQLREGHIDVICNVGIVTEGFDLPHLECAIVARPTMSLCMWLQMMGRVMRPAGRAIVLDHSGNALRHGGPLQEIKYSLKGKQPTEPSGLKRCPECLLMVESAVQVCPECGADLSAVSSPRDIAEVDGELVLFSEFAHRNSYWEDVKIIGEMRGYKDGWAAFRYKEKFGDWPVLVGDTLVDAKKATMEQKKAVYVDLLATARRQNFKDGWASHRYKGIFGVWPKGFVEEIRGDESADELSEMWQS